MAIAMLLGTAIFLALVLWSATCVQTSATGSSPAAACGAIQADFLTRAFGQGTSPLTGDELAYSPLLAALILATARMATWLTGAPPAGDAQAMIDTSVAFYSLTAIVLFVSFLALIVATGYFGRRAPGRFSRDALLVAASPIVLAVGLVSWDLIPLALTGIGLALLATRRTIPAALVLGIASCTGTMPIAVSVAVIAAAGLRGGLTAGLRVGLTWAIAFLTVHLPLMAVSPLRVWGYYKDQAGGSPGPGSLWYLAGQLGWDQPHAGSVGFSALAIALGCLFGLLRTTHRRPRVGSLIGIVILATVVIAPSFTPQTGLWVGLAVLVGRPFKRELIAVAVTQVAYALALWGHLSGLLTAERGLGWVYWVAILAHLGVAVWLLGELLWDVARPARDAVPTATVPDPLGGEFNDHPPRAARPATPALPQPATGWAAWRRPLLSAAIAVGITRVVYFGVGYLAQWLMVTEPGKPHFDWQIWLQWDAVHYLAIAEKGYVTDIVAGNAPAFFPLYPLMIRALTEIGIDPLHAGLLISAIATFVASVYLYRLAELHGFDGERSVVYALLFPTGVFLVAPYTEALFLAGAVPAFYYALRGKPWQAALFTAIAVGTRTVGLFVLLGVALELARKAWPSWKKLAAAVAAMVAASLPFWAYGLYLQQVRGSFWEFMTVQKQGWGRDFIGFTDGFLTTWRTWEGDYGANIIFTWRLEIVFAALSLGLLIWLMWRGYLGYSIYVGATLLIGLSNAWYYSTPRLALAFFPFAFLIAALVGTRERAHTYTVLALSAVAAVGTVAYTRGAWFF